MQWQEVAGCCCYCDCNSTSKARAHWQARNLRPAWVLGDCRLGSQIHAMILNECLRCRMSVGCVRRRPFPNTLATAASCAHYISVSCLQFVGPPQSGTKNNNWSMFKVSVHNFKRSIFSMFFGSFLKWFVSLFTWNHRFTRLPSLWLMTRWFEAVFDVLCRSLLRCCVATEIWIMWKY